MDKRCGVLVLAVLMACGSSDGCPEPKGWRTEARLENFVDVRGEACESTLNAGCAEGFVDDDSCLSLVDVARRLRVDGPGVVEDACESRAVVAGRDGSRADGYAVFEGDSEWSWTMRTDYPDRGTCCYVGTLGR